MKSTGIARIWHGMVKKEHEAIYIDYMIKTGVKDYKSTPGLLKAEILKKEEGDLCHIYTVTKWESYEAIKAFAGEDISKAQYYPEDKMYLLELEEEVQHFETLTFK